MSVKSIVSTTKAPAAIGPYSQAVKVGNLIFVSGQIPLDPESGKIVEGGVIEQTKRVMSNLEAILSETGAGLESIVKTTLYIKSMDDFPVVNDIYGSYFTKEPPARSCVEVNRLPKDALVEIEAIAFVPDK